MSEILDDGETYDVPPQVSLYDNMAAARLAGYQWPDIHDHVENAADQAMAAGYSPSQIDGHLGLTGNTGLIDRLGMAASEATTPSLINPDAEPGKTVGPITPDIAHEYAASLTAGEVTSPTEFGDAYAQAHGHDDPQFAKDMAAQLPTLEDTTDHAIAQLHLNGEDLTPDNVSVTRANMLDFWAQTGGTPDDILNSGDPLIQDAMTKPQPPNMPTLEELSKIGRDQISTAVPIIPGGNMTTDPTGLLGMAKSILELPGEELDHLKEVYQNPGTTLADRYEQLRNDPLLNTVSTLALQAIGAKVAGVAIPKIVEGAKEAGKSLPDLMYDTTGAIDIGKAIEDGKKSYADRAAEQEAAQKGEEPPEKIIDFTGMGKGVVDNLYAGLFQSLQDGKDTFAGIKDRVLSASKSAFDAGEIKSPEDLQQWVKDNYNKPEKKPEERQMIDLSSHPDYVQERIKGAFDSAQKMGVLDDIERLSAEGKTAIEVGKELGPKLDLVRKNAELNNETGAVAAMQFVRDARNGLGVPSQDQATEFKAWRDAYLQRGTAEAEKPKLLSSQELADKFQGELDNMKPEGEAYSDAQVRRRAELQTMLNDERRYRGTTPTVKSTLTSGELTPEQTAALQNGTRIEMKNPTTGEVHVGEGATPEDAMRNLAPKAAEAAKDTVDSLGKARVEAPVPVERSPDLQKLLRDEELEPADMEDDLNRLRTNATQDKVNLMKFADALPDEISQDKGLMSRVSRDIEKRTIDPNHEWSDETKTVVDMMRPLADRQFELGKAIAEKTSNHPMEEIEGIKSVDEGYVHRVVKGREGIQSLADPETEVNPITGARPRSLSKFAPGMESRADFYMFDKDGARNWGQKPLKDLGENPATGKPYKMGDTYEDPTGKYTIKPATMDEIEANKKGITYRDHYLANTVDNVARLERVNRNLDFLNKWLPGLEKHGLFVKAEGKFQFQAPDGGMIRVNLPGVNGWADPKFGRPLNDFFDAKPSDLEGFLTRAARWLQGSLFITPFKHIYNVGKHFIPARGSDWVKPSGYGSLMRNGAIAMREVATNGPLYERFNREGSGLLYASTETSNFHRVMFEKFYGEMQADRGGVWSSLARALQLDHLSDLVKAVYKWSNQTLWKYGDVMMLTRQLELQEKGMPIRQAIYQAEKDIPNYRVPSFVMGRPEMAQFLKSPAFFSFGRYRYGQTRAIQLMTKDLVGPKDDSRYATGHERTEAIGKAVAMAGMVMGMTPLLNYGLTQAWHAAGQKGNVDVWAGPETLINSVYGLVTGQKSYLAAMSSWLSLSPIMDVAAMIKTGKDALGRDIVNGSSSITGKVIQLLEAAGNLTYPGQLLLNALKPGGLAKTPLNLLGFNVHKEVSPEDQAKFDKRDKAAALKRESNDPIEQLVHSATGLGPDLNVSSGKGRGKGGGRSAEYHGVSLHDRQLYESGAPLRAYASRIDEQHYQNDDPLSSYGGGSAGSYGGGSSQGFAGDAASVLGQNPYGAHTASRSRGGSIGRAGGRTLSTGARRAIAIRYRGRR